MDKCPEYKFLLITRWGYRDGVKRIGDKIGKHYTNGAVGWVTE